MARLRFSTAQQIIDAYPSLEEVVTLLPRDVAPLAYIEKLLTSANPEQALFVFAFLLPRREAVRWHCQVLRKLEKPLSPEQTQLLSLAEAWVRSPTEETRRAALDAGMADKTKGAASWAALAAGWSGGSITNDVAYPVPPPASLTGQGVKVGMVVALAGIDQAQRVKKIREFASDAISLLVQGDNRD